MTARGDCTAEGARHKWAVTHESGLFRSGAPEAEVGCVRCDVALRFSLLGNVEKALRDSGMFTEAELRMIAYETREARAGARRTGLGAALKAIDDSAPGSYARAFDEDSDPEDDAEVGLYPPRHKSFGCVTDPGALAPGDAYIESVLSEETHERIKRDMTDAITAAADERRKRADPDATADPYEMLEMLRRRLPGMAMGLSEDGVIIDLGGLGMLTREYGWLDGWIEELVFEVLDAKRQLIEERNGGGY